MSRVFVTRFAVVVGLIWAGAFIDGAATGDWTAFGISTSVMLLAAGAVFGVRTPPLRRDDNDAG